MDSIILNLSIRWLTAVDAFSASCVSQKWRQILSADRDNAGADLWMEANLPKFIPREKQHGKAVILKRIRM